MTHESDAGRSDAGGSGAGRSWWDGARGPIAFGVAPLAAPLMACLVFSAYDAPESVLRMVVKVTLPLSYLGTLVLGLPLYLLLRAYRLTGFRWAATVGFVLGFATWYLFYALLAASLGYDTASVGEFLRNPAVFAWAILCGGLSGVAVGAVLWLIARPDRQTQ